MKSPLLAAFLFAGLAAPIIAQPPEGGRPEGARRGPGGWGGRMLPSTRAEAEQMATRRFEERDANRDGYLDSAELGERGAMMIERQDENHDGKISAAEATGGALAMFDRADADRNGTLSDAEREATMASFRERRPPRPRNLDLVPATRAEMQQLIQALFARQDADHDGFLSAAELGERGDAALARLDANRDHKVSAAENGAGLLALFDRVDADRDGTITPAERAAASAALDAPPSRGRPGSSGD